MLGNEEPLRDTDTTEAERFQRDHFTFTLRETPIVHHCLNRQHPKAFAG